MSRCSARLLYTETFDELSLKILFFVIGYLRKFAAEWRLDSLDAADKDLRRNGVILTH